MLNKNSQLPALKVDNVIWYIMNRNDAMNFMHRLNNVWVNSGRSRTHDGNITPRRTEKCQAHMLKIKDMRSRILGVILLLALHVRLHLSTQH